MLSKWKQFAGAIIISAGILVPVSASANLLSSSHFRLDPDVADSFGGSPSSASYKLTDAGGETAVGSGASGSYKLSQGYVAQLPHSLTLNVLPSGTYASWPLDTGSGTQAYDVSATRDQGTLQNGPTWGVGKLGNAVTFNGSTQYISTTTTQTNPATLTIEFWFKTTTATGGWLVGLGNTQTGASTTDDRVVYMANGGQLIFGVNNGSNRTISSASSYNDGAWHHVAATLGGAGMTMLVDGTRVATDVTTTSGANYTGYWRLGYNSLSGWPSVPTSNYFAGSLDEVRVATRQLSDLEVSGDYTAAASGQRFAHSLPNVVAGVSTNYSSDAIIRTDAGGYNVLVQATKLLTHTDGTTTIPMMSGTVAVPTPWTEGTTKGLGMSVTAAVQQESKWGVGPYNYAGVPLVATTVHSRTGLSSGLPETTTMQFRADTSSQQKPGTYSTTIVYTATLKP